MRSLFVILSQPDREAWAQAMVAAAAPAQAHVVVATPQEAARYLVAQALNPSHIVLDIGLRGHDVLEEIDALAQQCEPGTRVVVVGDTNDILLYRAILARGVLDYMHYPTPAPAVIQALEAPVAAAAPTPAVVTPAPGAATAPAHKRVIVFMSAASGDGASTLAINTAYAISKMANGRTVLVDMDYQFGMVAKHLGLQNQYGIADVFDYPERGVDAVLIKRMVASYGTLHVITAPAELRYLPSVNADAIRNLIATLSTTYDNVIFDVPHVWLPWVAAAAQQSTQLVLVAQLWLKSVSHAARMMRALREIGIPDARVTAVINRSGSKFREAIDPKDFERVCSTRIDYKITNDIKTIVTAEAAPSTLIELPSSQIARDIERLARGLLGQAETVTAGEKSGGFFSRLKG